MKNKILILSILLLPVLSFSQIPPPFDSIYAAARQEAANKNYDKAIEGVQVLIKQYPRDDDYKIFLGLVYAWMGNYNLSIITLSPVIERDSSNHDALQAIVNAHLWAEHWEQVITYCNVGLTKVDPQSVFYRLKKIRALDELKQSKAALDLLEMLITQNKANAEAQAMKTALYQNKKNAISLSYQNSSFSNPGFAPWHMGFLEYKINSKKAPFIMRANYGKMFGNDATQFEFDLYPKLSPTSFLYLNIGFSKGDYIFPSFRSGIEYSKSLKKIDLSFGANYMKFKAAEAKILKAGIAYNTGNWQIAYNPLISTIAENKWNSSHSVYFKKSNALKETYFKLDLQNGSIPSYFFNPPVLSKINATRIAVQYQFRLNMSLFLTPTISYEYEEYYPKQFRNRYNFQLVFTTRF